MGQDVDAFCAILREAGHTLLTSGTWPATSPALLEASSISSLMIRSLPLLIDQPGPFVVEAEQLVGLGVVEAHLT
jgi:hypothetical protein